MSSEITVKVASNGAKRRFLMMYYDCPRDGRRHWKSTKKTTRREADREAGKWQAELREGRYQPPSSLTWQEFRRRYEDEVASDRSCMAARTDQMISTVFNAIERVCHPQKLHDLDAGRLSHFRSEIRKGRSVATVRTYLAHIKSALAWAVDQELLPAVPKIKMPERGKGSKVMKGRPITGEELERMLAKIETGLIAASKAKYDNKKAKKRIDDATRKRLDEKQAHAAAAAAPSWRHYLKGLWLSGLRLEESLDLHWSGPRGITVDLSAKRPVFRIPAECEKGNKDRLLPIAPEFAAFLLRTPETERHGRVFKLLGASGKSAGLQGKKWVGKIVSAIGKAAGVKVNERDGKVKYASAHDLRRAFGTRWATRVMPAVLKEMMRHESIETTMKYYVGLEAQSVSDVIWDAFSKATDVDSRAEAKRPAINTPVHTSGSEAESSTNVNACDNG